MPLPVCMRGRPDERGERPRDTVAAFSAVPTDYLRGPPAATRLIARFCFRVRSRRACAVSRRDLPIVLAAIGIMAAFTVGTGALAAGALAFDGSMGLNGVVISGPVSIFSPLHSVRVPARFGMFVVLTLAMLAGRGAARVMSGYPEPADPRRRSRLPDHWPLSPMPGRIPIDCRCGGRHQPFMRRSRTGRSCSSFPVHQPADRFTENLPYMYFSIWHWRPMVNGYSGFIPGVVRALLAGVATFPDARRCSFSQRWCYTRRGALPAVGIKCVSLNDDASRDDDGRAARCSCRLVQEHSRACMNWIQSPRCPTRHQDGGLLDDVSDGRQRTERGTLPGGAGGRRRHNRAGHARHLDGARCTAGRSVHGARRRPRPRA